MPESLVPSTSVVPVQCIGGQIAISTTGLGVADVLADIRKFLASLSASSTVPAVSPSPLPVISTSAEIPLVSIIPQVTVQDSQAQNPTTQALGEISRLLATINVPVSSPSPPTTPWNVNDSLQNSVAELKQQVDVLGAALNVATVQAVTGCLSVSPAPGAVTPAAPLEKDRLNETNTASANVNASTEGSGIDALLSKPGKMAAHVSAEVKAKIWKGEFVYIFSLIRAKRREVESKDKEAKASSSVDKKPRVEENITHWLFGFNVFMSVMLEKKPDLGIAKIFYSNKILKAHHVYGGATWLECDRDFRWAKIEDPSIGWDQTEVNVWDRLVHPLLYDTSLNGTEMEKVWFNAESSPAKYQVSFERDETIDTPFNMRLLRFALFTYHHYEMLEE
ncbi:hypothetical protein NDU88_000200 [Pleurodeles waltl]|uniref:Uncharacterized protein n=1 Tax=Pleurodeles waltl TaxID=8319 RepID=A0AAV7TFZ7_PLEWA|nr:hypothetical protein NDU88_000200 [Pleurodeles waltl]